MENKENNRLLMAFYGDDFTGSTDALEFLCKAGVKTVLFIDVPTKEQLLNYADLQAIGVAGVSRALSPVKMEAELLPTFEALKELKPQHVHYKVCSTFDSSPTIGSIGKAIDVGQSVFKGTYVPLLVAAPALGRYCLFGNLFARMGIGSDGDIYRLDRHPSMSKHPVTPSDESDLCLHLGKQTNKKIALLNITALHQYAEKHFDVDFGDHEIVLFDALKAEDLIPIGEIIAQSSKQDHIVFSVGSSGIEMALGSYWKEKGIVKDKLGWGNIKCSKPILVISGSCSPVTSSQIKYALDNGFAEIAIDTVAFANRYSSDSDIDENLISIYVEQVVKFISDGKNVLIHTSLGNDDLRVVESDKIFNNNELNKSTASIVYGRVLGEIAKKVAEKTNLERLVIAGGDTSSYAARAMGIEAMEMISPLTAGAPLCKVHSTNSDINNLHVVFKGGQVGKQDFFVQASKDIINIK